MIRLRFTRRGWMAPCMLVDCATGKREPASFGPFRTAVEAAEWAPRG